MKGQTVYLFLLLTRAFTTTALTLFPLRTASLSIPSCYSTYFLFPESNRRSIQNIGREQHLAATSSATPLTRDNDIDGGIFAFQTKYGRLNPFAIYFGIVSIFLGLPWFLALTLCQIFYKVCNNRLDVNKRIPHFLSHLWGWTLLRLSRSFPKIEGEEILKKFLQEKRAGMFVANHSSWMDIPFLGATVGFQQNYKFVSKAELRKVPILGKSIETAGHVMVDRMNIRSQVMTVKNGIRWLKNGVHLCTFPEGTRSKSGRVLPFKNGAFKMAQKVNAPIIPLSIVGSFDTHPYKWIFPRKASRSSCKVVVHEPIESSGMTEQELSDAVREAVLSGLPEGQQPLTYG